MKPNMMRAMSVLFTVAPLTLLAPLGGVASAEDTSAAVDFVLDSSGSMAGKDPSGGTKLVDAKRAMGTMIDGLPDNSKVGLRVYGARYADKARGCTDTQVVFPVGPLDRTAAKSTLGAFKPVGHTPIGYSLRQAVKDLPATGQRTIVLVSDGE